MEETRIITLSQDTWCVEDCGVRCFILKGTKSGLLIDTGMKLKGIRKIAEDLTGLPVRLINTHADPDHIGANSEFGSFMMHPSECANYYGMFHGKGDVDPVYDGDEIDLGERELEIILIPGHTPGSIMLLDRRNRILFSGDSVQDGRIFLFGPMRDIHGYILGLKRLRGWEGKFDRVYPSHGSLPLELGIIPSLIDGAERVMRGEVEGNKGEAFGQSFIVYDIGCARILGKAD